MSEMNTENRDVESSCAKYRRHTDHVEMAAREMVGRGEKDERIPVTGMRFIFSGLSFSILIWVALTLMSVYMIGRYAK